MIDRKKIALVIFGLLFAAAVVLVFYLSQTLHKNSGIQIDTFPKAKVFLNDKDSGSTPFYKEGLAPGDYSLKLVPDGGTGDTNFETKVKLVPGVLTMVTRVFGQTVDSSSGQVVYLDKTSLSDISSIAIVSDPDGSLVKIDGEEKGVTPLALKDLSAGTHEILIVKPGFDSQTVSGKLEKGFELRIFVKLAKAGETQPQTPAQPATSSASPASPSAAKKTPPPVVVTTPKPVASSSASGKEVLILDTPTGFLRVRFEPSTTASEVARVKPGEKYPLLEEASGWMKIKLDTLVGWISSQYASKQ